MTIAPPHSLTQGSITRQITWFAIPLLGSSLIQLLYSTVDLLFVGQFLGTRAAAAVGASGLIVTCLIGISTGLSSGAGVLAARHFGARLTQPTSLAIHTGIAFSLVSGTLLTAIITIWGEVFLGWLSVPEAILSEALTYLRFYACGILAMLVFNMGAALLRALGDSMSPMISQLIGGLANVAGNTLFIVMLQWGIGGAAVATVMTQSLAAGLVLHRLRRLDPGLRLDWRKIRISFATMRSMLHIGLPASVQAVVITFSNLVVQHRINDLGVTEIAAYTVWFRVENLCYFPAMALGQAIAIFVAQNLGADQPARAHRGVLTCLAMTVGTQVVLCFLLWPGADTAFSLFTSDPDVIAVGSTVAQVILPWYLLFGVMEVLASALRGAAQPIVPMAVILLALCGGRIVSLSFFPGVFHTATLVATAYPLTWAVTVTALGVYYAYAVGTLRFSRRRTDSTTKCTRPLTRTLDPD